MANRFTLGKTDTVDICNQADLLSLETVDQCDDQMWYDVLKRKAYEPFIAALKENLIHHDEDHTSMTNFNPWKYNFDSNGGAGSESYFNFTSATACEIVVTPSLFPFFTTFGAVTENRDGANKYSGSYGTAWTVGGTLKGDVTNFFKSGTSRGDQTSQIQNRSALSWSYPAAATTPISFMSHMNICGRVKSAVTASVESWVVPSLVTTGHVAGGARGSGTEFGFLAANSTSYVNVVKPVNTHKTVIDYSWRSTVWMNNSAGAEPATHAWEMDWMFFYEDGETPPATYPSSSERKNASSVITYKVTGTALTSTYAYIEFDTAGGTVALKHSTTGAFGGEETAMTQEISNSGKYLYSTIGHASTSSSYIQLQLGTAGSSPNLTTGKVTKFAMQAVDGTDVFLIDGDTMDEPNATSFTQQFEDMSKSDKVTMQKQEFWNYMKAARAQAVSDTFHQFQQGNSMYTFGSWFISTAEVSSTTFTYDAGNDHYYIASPTYAAPSNAEKSPYLIHASIGSDNSYDTGVAYDLEQGQIGFVKEWTPNHELMQDDDQFSRVIVGHKNSGTNGSDDITYTIKYSTNTTSASWTSITGSPFTEDGTTTGAEYFLTKDLAAPVALTGPPFYVFIEVTGRTMDNDDEMDIGVQFVFDKKTYASKELVTTTFNTTHDFLYVGLLMNRFSYLDDITAEYWDGAAYQTFTMFTPVDVSALATTKLRFTMASKLTRIKPILEGFVAVNFANKVAGRTI